MKIVFVGEMAFTSSKGMLGEMNIYTCIYNVNADVPYILY